MRSKPLAIATIAALAVLGACSSDDSSESTAGDAPSTTTTAAPVDDGAGAAGSGEEEASSEVEDGQAAVAALPDPCDELTAEEFTAASGVTVTADLDMSGGCAYSDADGTEIALLTVATGDVLQSTAEGFLEFPPPSVTFTKVDGLGTIAVVSDPPEGRAVLVVDDVGYDLSKGFGSTPLDAAQLEAALRSIVAS